MASNAPAESASNLRGTIGFLLVRGIVPLWVLSGALFKLWERNPKLLPKPVLDVSRSMSGWFGVPEGEFGTFLDHTLRFLIGTELLLVAVMFFAPKLARLAAIFTLSVFVLVLIGVLRLGADKCGCFGAGGPPPWAMLLVDAVLLLGVIVCKPAASLFSRGARTALVGGVGAVLAYAVAWAVPNPVITVLPAPPLPPAATTQGTIDGTGDGIASSAAAGSASAWPAAPTPKTTYITQFDGWLNKPLREQDLALQIARPLPDGIDSGAWFVVFYRGDCEHCHELLEHYLSKEHAPRTIAVRVPDTDAANDQPMPSDQFTLRTLPQGANYVFTTPVMLTVVDGVVKAMATDPKDERAMKTALDAAQGRAVSPPPAVPVAAASTPGVPAAAPWPAAPPVETTYAPTFESWTGKRLDSQGLALQMTPAVPQLNSGRWHVLFYRADCDHCHELMQNHLVGDLEPRVIAVRVPDTDPAQDLDMPLTRAVLAGLPLGANYVFTTPILLTVQDGVVVGLATDPEDEAQVTGALEAK